MSANLPQGAVEIATAAESPAYAQAERSLVEADRPLEVVHIDVRQELHEPNFSRFPATEVAIAENRYLSRWAPDACAATMEA